MQATEKTSDVGNMAWVGQALVQLYEASGDEAHVSAAAAAAVFVAMNAATARPFVKPPLSLPTPDAPIFGVSPSTSWTWRR